MEFQNLLTRWSKVGAVYHQIMPTGRLVRLHLRLSMNSMLKVMKYIMSLSNANSRNQDLQKIRFRLNLIK